MLDGRIDLLLAVTFDLGFDANFERQRLCAARPHALLRSDNLPGDRRDLSLKDLADEPSILCDEGLSARHVLGLFREIGAPPVVRDQVRSLELMRSLAGNGDGVGISYSVPPGSGTYDSGRVAAVPIVDESALEPVILARSGTAPEREVTVHAGNIVVAHFAGGRDDGGSAMHGLSEKAAVRGTGLRP